ATKRSRPTSSPPRCTSGSARAGRGTSPTGSCPPCAGSSGGTTRRSSGRCPIPSGHDPEGTTMTSGSITGSPEWQALAEHAEEIRDVHLRTLFADDPGRGQSMTLEAADLFLDYSKNRIIAETLRLLLGLADRA